MDVALLTVSYRGDLELARDLCASVDAHVDPAIEHVLLVPERDASLFANLATGRRRLVAIESILPSGFSRLPTPYRIELKPFFSKRIREIWATPKGLVRGWIIQQIVKLSAHRATNAPAIVFADSDIVFVRAFNRDTVVRGDLVRLYHRPGETSASAPHRRWHREAAELLGLPATDYFGADYIGNLLSWRRDTLEKLQARLEEIGGAPWQNVLAGAPALSEYILYGAFAEHVLGDASGHYLSTEDLAHPSWHYDIARAESREAFLRDFSDNHLAVLIQSTEGLGLDARRALIAAMTEKRQRVA
jgi:hypothetical protein